MIDKTPAEQLRAYSLMLGDLDGSPIYWLHFAQIYAELPGRPAMLLGRAETCAIVRFELEGQRVVRSFYREAGLYFGPQGDRPLTEYKNPITGKVAPVESGFREGPAVFTMTARDDGVFGNTELDQKSTRRMPWVWLSSGNRICVTNDDAGIWKHADPTSHNVQAAEPTAGRIMQTWHADSRDLDNRSLSAVPCFKNYVVTTSAWPTWAGDPGERGAGFIRGMAAKLTPVQAAAYPEIERLKRAHPDFFAESKAAP